MRDQMRHEMKLYHDAQSKVAKEQDTALRHRLESSIQAERDARLWDSADLRTVVQGLHARVAQCHAQVSRMSQREPSSEPVRQRGEKSNSPVRHMAKQGSSPSLHQHAQVQELLGELEAEREVRSCRDAELHERLGREAGMLARRLEEVRIAFAEDIAESSERTGQQQMELDRSLRSERQERCQDADEIRAILRSVWQQAQEQVPAAGLGKRTHARVDSGQDADQQDVATVYEMATEALGDIHCLRQQLAGEEESRKREQQEIERQVRTIRALLGNDATGAPVLG